MNFFCANLVWLVIDSQTFLRAFIYFYKGKGDSDEDKFYIFPVLISN